MNIAVIGRSLGSVKWESLFDILDQGMEAEVWTYKRYEVDKLNKTDFNDQVFDCHILVATKPICEDKTCIRFNISTTEEEILTRMQEFADSLTGEEDGSIPDISSTVDVIPTDGDVLVSNDVDPIIPSVCEAGMDLPTITSDTTLSSFRGKTSSIAAIQIEINGEDVFVTHKEAMELKEMMEVMSAYGYKIKKVIVNGIDS